MSNKSEFVVSVLLYVRRGKERQFRDFERQALQPLSQYGGRMVIAVRLNQEASDAESPYELHVLSFPTEAEFRAFREDKKQEALKDARQNVLAKTELFVGLDVTASL